MQLNVHLDLQAHGVKLLRSISSHAVVASSMPLPVRTARAARSPASFGWLSARLVAVANSAQCSLLLRQVSRVFGFFVQVRAPLPLRLLSRIGNRVLPVNKALKSDKVKPSCLLQKAQKPRQLHFAL
jgi:hypothetical protein